MKFHLISILLAIGLVASKPITDTENGALNINHEIFLEDFVVYRGAHDIVDIMLPLTDDNFGDDSSESNLNEDDEPSVFFIEGEIKENSEIECKGLYVLKKSPNNANATKVLDNGTSMTFDAKHVYFGANDGIYKYDAEEKKAKKYGEITDSIKSIVKFNETDRFIILTQDGNTYEVTEHGDKKQKLDFEIKPKQMVIGYDQALYYYGEDNQFYVKNGVETKQITGLPANPDYVRLVKPPFVIQDGVVIFINNKVYTAYSNGTSEVEDIDMQIHPTGYSMEAALIHFYAHDKKIYSYNLILILLTGIFDELNNYLEEFKDSIQALATHSRGALMF